MIVEISKKALDDLERISRSNRKKAIEILSIIEHELSCSPFIGKKLKGRYKSQRSYRVGNYRIVYSIAGDKLTIRRVDNRKDVYRK